MLTFNMKTKVSDCASFSEFSAKLADETMELFDGLREIGQQVKADPNAYAKEFGDKRFDIANLNFSDIAFNYTNRNGSVVLNVMV